jgi:serine/threonine-protein kinase ATR
MTSASHGRLQEAPGQVARQNGETNPPPSTLAAQLVENISTAATSKTTRSTENGEFKRLFATIENIKNNPDLLQTPEDRIRHNHMLIYVYFRAVLDALRPDDPFLDKERIRAEGSKAIHFFRLAVLETPSVLICSTEPDEFLSRGSEPLWTWAFPKILRLLGHPLYHELSEPMTDLCRVIFKLCSRHTQLRHPVTSVVYYLREIVVGMVPSAPKHCLVGWLLYLLA